MALRRRRRRHERARTSAVALHEGTGTLNVTAPPASPPLLAGTLAANLPGVSTDEHVRHQGRPHVGSPSPASDVTLDILGNTLTGDFSFEQSAGHHAPRHRGRARSPSRGAISPQGDQRRSHDQRRRRHRPPRRHGRHPRDRRAHAHERRAEHRPTNFLKVEAKGAGFSVARPDAHRRPRDHAPRSTRSRIAASQRHARARQRRQPHQRHRRPARPRTGLAASSAARRAQLPRHRFTAR